MGAKNIRRLLTGNTSSVTQLTNKTTGVTISTTSGVITTANVALGGGDEGTFTVTNAEVKATSVIVLSVKSGGTSGEYIAAVGAVADGSFDIVLMNVTAGSLTDPVLINFAAL